MMTNTMNVIFGFYSVDSTVFSSSLHSTLVCEWKEEKRLVICLNIECILILLCIIFHSTCFLSILCLVSLSSFGYMQFFFVAIYCHTTGFNADKNQLNMTQYKFVYE